MFRRLSTASPYPRPPSRVRQRACRRQFGEDGGTATIDRTGTLSVLDSVTVCNGFPRPPRRPSHALALPTPTRVQRSRTAPPAPRRAGARSRHADGGLREQRQRRYRKGECKLHSDGHVCRSTAAVTFGIANAPPPSPSNCPVPSPTRGSHRRRAAVYPASAVSTSPTVDHQQHERGYRRRQRGLPGRLNHTGNNASEDFEIGKAETTTTVTCPAGPYTYDGSAQEPCSARVAGPGGLDEADSVTYQNNTNAGTATANATYAGAVNHSGSTRRRSTSPSTRRLHGHHGDLPCRSVPTTARRQTPVLGHGHRRRRARRGRHRVAYTNNTNAGNATASASLRRRRQPHRHHRTRTTSPSTRRPRPRP